MKIRYGLNAMFTSSSSALQYFHDCFHGQKAAIQQHKNNQQFVTLAKHYLSQSPTGNISSGFTCERAGGCVVKVLARGSEGHRFDARVHQLSD